MFRSSLFLLRHRAPQMHSLLTTPSLSLSLATPSISTSRTSSSSPLPSSSASPSSSPFSSAPTPTPTPSPSSSPPPSSSSSDPSSTPSSATSFTSSPSTSSTSTTSTVTDQQQSYSTSAPTSVATAAGALDPNLSSSVPIHTSAPSPTSTTSSSSGFFANTGAFASTFTIVGLVAIAAVIAVALLIIRRRHSRSDEEDMEYLDRSPDLSNDPPMTQVMSEDGFTSDHGHFGQSPLALATPPTVYYPDHPYTLPAEPPAPQTYPSPYPAAYTQDYAAHHIYATDAYNTAFPPRVNAKMHNPPGFTDMELDSAPVTQNQSTPVALRPSAVKSSATVPWSNTRFSVDSFYAGIVTDNHSSGHAL